MKCPNCEETLVMTERQGVEIDYCPKCRGVWLDKGELDKIIERTADYNGPDKPSTQQQQPLSPQQGHGSGQGYYGGGGHHDDHHGGHHGDGYNKHGRRGFFGKMFDF